MGTSEELQEKIRTKILELLTLLGIEAEVETEDREGQLTFNIKSKDSRMLIGQYGQNLKALQHIIRLLVRKNWTAEHEAPVFYLDVEGYRKSRQEFLAELARKAAFRVRTTKQTLILKPMSSYDRRVIHMYLKDSTDLITESIGEEPERRVVIKLKV